MKLSDLGVRQRLFMGFGGLLLLLTAELAFTMRLFRRIDEQRQLIAEDVGPRARAANRLERAILERAVALRNYGLTRDPRYLGLQAESAEEARSALGDIKTLVSRPEGRAIAAELRPAAQAHAGATDAYLGMLREGASPERLAPAEREVALAREKLFQVTRRFSDYQQRKLEKATAQVEAIQGTMSWGLPCLALLMLATFGVTALLVVRAVADPVRQLLAAARSLSKGDYRRAVALDPAAAQAGPGAGVRGNELRELAAAMAHAAGKLERREAALAADVKLSGVLAVSLAVDQLADDALRAIAFHLRAEVGAVYVFDEDGAILRRVASFALDGGARELAAGEGIPGQAATQKQSIHVRDVPPDTPFRVRLGFDSPPPRSILAVPVLHRKEARGVILLASLREFTDEAVRFAEHAANVLAPALENAVAHREVVRFRAALQEKNEELSAQNEELQAQREEIQVQNEEIQAQNEELQEQGEQLQRAVEARMKADRRKDDFLATLGHELRNPLAAIDHAVRVLEKRAPASVSAQVAVISRQERQLARLMDDLLDVSRIERGKLVLRKLPVDMGQILRQAAESSRGFIESRRHELSLQIGAGDLAVEGDPARLEQIICNLLHNAAKFTDEGGAIAASVAREGEDVVLRVKDTGVGIDREFLPRVFDLFAQGQVSLHRGGGLGVGLSLVRSLVEMHGGRVRALSDGPRRGSEFVVSLPGAEGHARAVERATPPPVTAGSRPLHVLVVDDNPDVADSLAELVRDWGHVVEIERTGKGALEAATRSAPDVVLLDIGLPDESGYEVARELRRRLGPFSLTRIIAMSGHGREEDRLSAADAGFDAYFLKASTGDELQATLARLALDRAGAPAV